MFLNRTLTVSELNHHVKDLLETHFLTVEVSGEISGFVAAASGHWYFTLKDAKSQVKCAMFRRQNATVVRPPKNGDKVSVKVRVTLYEARGDFQLVANSLQYDGTGALLAAFEQLKTKLDQEGLFSPEHKKPIPAVTKEIGVITSSTGAAIQDILHVTQRRFPSARITLYPTQVQGKDAPLQIMAALHKAIQHNKCDVLIIGRGGGSIEDLWCFNDEQLARMVFNCPIPIISAVGHEIDFTITDFVADLRAPTPSAAAEIVTPDQFEWLARLNNIEKRLVFAINQRLKSLNQRLALFNSKLVNPKQKLERNAQTLDELTFRLHKAIHTKIEQKKSACLLAESKLNQFHPKQQIEHYKLKNTQLDEQLKKSIQKVIREKQHAFSKAVGALQIISPLNTLQRGYSITTNESNKVIQTTKSVKVGDQVSVQLHEGDFKAEVTSINR
ncbi:exodeoxyribonuclease VII large subunit [Litoribacillus peritrichatus]|uniref:Exodeoxyribonuclease 7 large subunit n=1 Tax=Litoribacillus peritrichatus TaxID=718191 RepID=A0ABP7M3Q9_9GAMM